MLSTFHTLKERYASREITLEDLEALQQYNFIRFENRGISRSERDCLLCEVYCEPLEGLLASLKATVFSSLDALREQIRISRLELSENIEEALATYQSRDSKVEIVALLEPNGQVRIDPDDIEADAAFQVYLRIQH